MESEHARPLVLLDSIPQGIYADLAMTARRLAVPLLATSSPIFLAQYFGCQFYSTTDDGDANRQVFEYRRNGARVFLCPHSHLQNRLAVAARADTDSTYAIRVVTVLLDEASLDGYIVILRSWVFHGFPFFQRRLVTR